MYETYISQFGEYVLLSSSNKSCGFYRGIYVGLFYILIEILSLPNILLNYFLYFEAISLCENRLFVHPKLFGLSGDSNVEGIADKRLIHICFKGGKI